MSFSLSTVLQETLPPKRNRHDLSTLGRLHASFRVTVEATVRALDVQTARLSTRVCRAFAGDLPSLTGGRVRYEKCSVVLVRGMNHAMPLYGAGGPLIDNE